MKIMCGFAGGSFSNIKLLKNISKTLLKRAKQEVTYYVDDEISFFHAPLQISDINLDTTQPYVSDTAIVGLVGEIYNKSFLLRKVNLPIDTIISEVELIQKLYLKLGPDFINFINGEFSIYIYDRNKKKHFLFRDRYGIHSVYYRIKEGNLFFSSHMQDLAHLGEKISINREAFLEYLVFQFSISPNTIFENVYILPPATYLEFSSGTVKRKSFKKYQNQDIGGSFLSKFEQAVVRRIPKYQDKVFIPLSGGKDSNLVLYYLRKHFKGEIVAYSFLNNNNIKDFENAKKNADYHNITHVTIENNDIIAGSFLENIHLHEGLVKLYNMSGALRELYPKYGNINVEFSGDGREELLRVNNHFNYKQIEKKYNFLRGKNLLSSYDINNDFLNLNMFDFNLQLIEKLTLNHLIERRLPFTDYELLSYEGYSDYSSTVYRFLTSRGISIVDGTYGHNTGIAFRYIESKNDLVKYLKHFINKIS